MTASTLTTTKAPFRYDLVGSLLRPAALKQAHSDFEAGKIDQAQLETVQHQEIKRVVEKQAALGFKDVTDGEFSRRWWHLDFLWGLTGVNKVPKGNHYGFKGEALTSDDVTLVGKVAYNPEHPFFKAFQYLKSVTPKGIVPKQTIPSPSLIIRDNLVHNVTDFYDNRQDYLDDLAKAYHETVLHFYELGARYIQLDDTSWAYLIEQLNDTKDKPAEHAKYEKWGEEFTTVLQAILQDLPQDLTVTTHICRGNFHSTFLFTGGYAPVIKYLKQLPYAGFFLEYDNERSGDFSPLAELHAGQPNSRLVLGLVTSKTPELETEATLKQRIQEATKYVPLENLALSTQCGFASTAEGNKLTEAQQWAKLTLVKKVATAVWGQA
ncbi:5-methyltetrahydropteroyltriglutamate--homocysteine s-methyltransferase [Agrilactobacillus composti DSM 18527 = JCM 14202]|uniref:5-methyltetrahydropteroyltriglutamate--homocysteine s-methyltransferase n=1 Tax=Agrilactobacillus composti DSM 18527 = JCM 14202 TaxID=1423734 RepID=A0A0R1XVT5_9LACO|nr:vitamin B12 independent methionine synthase [Agrilactobacillus composti]KRM30915.1 5-methyltetrahydropteroyltriglutamate--homocysteine s-methyltransferase [Agrilactobacillus composti DSM 18527 = JCM 14202]